MRPSSLLASAILLLAPLTASAAFETPSQLFHSLQQNSVDKSFSVTAHGEVKGTFFSIWANGKEGVSAEAPAVSMKATVDIVSGPTKIRIKGDVIALGDTLYLKVSDIQGTKDPAAKKLMQEKGWISMPLGNSDLSKLSGNVVPVGLSSTDASAADSMFTLTSAPWKGNKNYVLSLSPDFAPELALRIRKLLNDTQPVSDDFFPWRELGESIKFSMYVLTTPKDAFLSSGFSLSLKSKSSIFTVKGTEQALSKPLNISAPSIVSPSSDVLPALEQLTGTVMKDESSSSSSFDSVDEKAVDAACNDPMIAPSKLVELQRTGVCPFTKVPTRFRW